MSKSKFTKHLKELGIEEMRHELIELYTKIAEVRRHYAMELGTDKDRQRIYDKAKKDIISKYATKSIRKPRRPRIQKINIILRDLEKASIFKHEMIDIYLFDIETALVFILKYGFYSTTLENHIKTVFAKGLLLIQAEQLQSTYQERCEVIFKRSLYMPEIHYAIRDEYQECYDN